MDFYCIIIDRLRDRHHILPLLSSEFKQINLFYISITSISIHRLRFIKNLSLYRLGSGWSPGYWWWNVSSRERVKPRLLWLNIIIRHIFPEDFIEIPQVVLKILISPSILTMFINFLDFLTYPCYKKTNTVSI